MGVGVGERVAATEVEKLVAWNRDDQAEVVVSGAGARKGYRRRRSNAGPGRPEGDGDVKGTGVLLGTCELELAEAEITYFAAEREMPTISLSPALRMRMQHCWCYTELRQLRP